jgi:hypothetical protein
VSSFLFYCHSIKFIKILLGFFGHPSEFFNVRRRSLLFENFRSSKQRWSLENILGGGLGVGYLSLWFRRSFTVPQAWQMGGYFFRGRKTPHTVNNSMGFNFSVKMAPAVLGYQRNPTEKNIRHEFQEEFWWIE